MRVASFSRFFSLLLGLLAGSAALAQQNWQWVNMLPASIGWKSAAYGNGLYVVVGSDGALITSPDTITWTVRKAVNTAANLNGVAFANNRFVAVGSDSSPNLGSALIITSPDGITWTKNETIASTILAQLNTVAFGNNTWVISGASQNRVLTSPDGLTWMARNSTANTGRMVFGAGLFVASTNNNRAVTSPDGITWTSVTLHSSTSSFYEDIAYGAGRFVAVGRNGTNFTGAAVTSTDGATWTATPDMPDSSNGVSWVEFANNVFVASGSGGLFSSPDGAAWTKRTSAMPPTRASAPNSLSTENVGSVAAANNTLFAFGIYGSITTSSDGATWTRRSTGTAHDINGLVWDGTRFVGVGTGGTVVTSPDGIAWTARTSNQTGWFGRLAYANGVYAAAGINGLWTSTDLTTWTNRGNTTFNQMWGVIHASGRFVAANTGISTGLLVSTDGITWTNIRITGASGSVQGLAWGGGLYIVTVGGFGSTARIYSSPDATTWTERTPTGFTGTPESVAYANGRFALLTGNNSWTSPDGITWTNNPVNLSALLRTVYSLGDKFIARDGYACVLSDDGATWTALANSTTANIVIAAMVVKDNKVIAAGGGGGILRGDLAGAAPTTLTATVTTGSSVQWLRNGNTVSGAVTASLSLPSVQPADAGIYSAAVTAGGATTLQSFVVGVSSTAKVIGTGSELAANIPHPNKNIFDQILLEGAAATVTADAGQAIRLSYVDLQNDIVQVEFSGAGTLSIVLDGMSGPAAPVNYNQPTVSYVKGHAGIVVTGANETTNLLIFSVGRATAFDPTGGYNILAAPSTTNVPANNGSSLFQGKAGTSYDGLADIAFVAISSTNGKFGGLRTSNTSYWATKGPTGIYAPGVEFIGPVFVHDINAQATALPVFVIGSSTDTRITGGDLLQANNAAVQVAGLTQLKFTAGITSHGGDLSAKTNAGRLEQNGVDVSTQIVVNP